MIFSDNVESGYTSFVIAYGQYEPFVHNYKDPHVEIYQKSLTHDSSRTFELITIKLLDNVKSGYTLFVIT